MEQHRRFPWAEGRAQRAEDHSPRAFSKGEMSLSTRLYGEGGAEANG